MATDYRVIIPDESYLTLEFEREGLPAVAVVNSALCLFEPKVVFSWHLSLILDLKCIIEDGMPSKREREVIDPFGNYLDSEMKGSEPDKPNVLFLARVTWNETRQLIWRVYNPELVNNRLQEIISQNESPRQFDYRMEYDPDWKYAEWYLKCQSAKELLPPNGR